MKQKLVTYCSVREGHTPSCHTRLLRFHTIAHGPAAQAALQSLFGRLMRIGDLNLRSHARSVLAKGGLAREAVLASYQPCLSVSGNPVNRKKVFEASCSPYHKINNIGIVFGPELTSLRNRPAGNILESILMPNKTIADMYETWQVELKNGKILEGIITDRTSSSFTLRMMGGSEQIITKREVENLKTPPASSMPEGLESGISLPEMADLLAFIKGMK